MRYAPLVLVALLCVPAQAVAAGLPSRLAPAPPFPRIVQQAPEIEQVAPGVEYAEYRISTTLGPLSVHALAVDLNRSDVHVGDVLANNSMSSKGETVGSMAKRTGAIGGINGDYFDIGNTNRPLNIVVRDGTLLAMPRKRYALAVGNDGTPQIAEFKFTGEVVVGDRTLNVDGIDELPPPNGGVSFLTPDYGTVAPEENLTLIALELLDGKPPSSARFRVKSVADNLSPQPPGYYLGVGAAEYGWIQVPSPGDTLSISGDLEPAPLSSLQTAIGGGPLILHGGSWFDDPDGPNGGEFSKRIPSSGLGITGDGRLLLLEVDGRSPTTSVGLTRHEFAALFAALGAREAMALDGGGSSTMVVRRLGDAQTSVTNDPSDGIERPVGNGLLVYSTAPVGPAVRLVARPQVVRAITGADVPVRVAAVDAANHVTVAEGPIAASVEPPGLGIFKDGRLTALAPGIGRVVLRSGRLRGEFPIEVARTPASLTIFPLQPNVDRGGTLALRAQAYDAHGYRLTLPSMLPWTASGAAIDAFGSLRAGNANAKIALRVGEASTEALVTVGSHGVGIPFAERAHFVTLPHGGEGSLQRNAGCATCVQLSFSFGAKERAAYAMADVPLPPQTIGVEFDVQDDGSDARLRLALRNSINEQVLVNATTLDGSGWRHVVVKFGADASSAERLTAIYVLPPKGMQLSSGQIVIRNVRAIVAGQ